MNKRKLISVIIPFYNVEKYISICLRSVIHQDLLHNEFEIICVNDGSTDKSVDIIREYMKKNENIRIIDASSKGVSSARNDGLKVACGEYVWFVDADDYICKNCMRTLYSIGSNNGLECLLFGRTDVKEDENVIRTFTSEGKLEIEENVSEIFTPSTHRAYDGHNVAFMGAVWFMIYKKDFLYRNNIYFDEHLFFYEDEIFTYCCRKRLNKVGYYEVPVYFHRRRNDSLSGSDSIQKRKIHQKALLTTCAFYKNEENHLKKGYEKEELTYLISKIKSHSSLSYDLLFGLSDKSYIKSQLSEIEKWKEYIFSSTTSTSRKRKVANFFGRILPFKPFFWLMWTLHNNNRQLDERKSKC